MPNGAIGRSGYALLAMLAAQAAGAATTVVTPAEDLRAAIAGLEPGDELVLRGGTYALDSRFNITVVGTRPTRSSSAATPARRP